MPQRFGIFVFCLIGFLIDCSDSHGQRAERGSGNISVSGAVLQIDGTMLDDTCVVSSISRNRLLIVLNRKATRISAEGIMEINFLGSMGDDSFTNHSKVSSTADGGPGDDFLKSSLSQATFYGGVGNDSLFGGPLDDVLCGGSDDDLIFGGKGNDLINGDASEATDDETDDEVDELDDEMESGGTEAELLGEQAVARGRFVQIGINELGTFGVDGTALPGGFVDVVSDGRASLSDTFGFIADSGLDGFEGGDYDGDFFTPGQPEEGFTLEFNGQNFSNNLADFSPPQVPGMITGVSGGSRAEIAWEGSIEGMKVERKIRVYPNGLFIQLEVVLTNESSEAVSDVFYMNNLDPDNDQTLHSSFATFNQIISQGDSDPENISLVTAQQDESGGGMSGGTEETGSAISLVSFDPRARVSFGGFRNRDASAVYFAEGLDGTVGDSRIADEAISLAFNVGTLEPGASTTLTYYYSLDPTGIDISGITDLDNDCSDNGTPGNDIVYGEAGNDIIITDAGDDTVFGGGGNDTIDSGDDNDRVYGQSGDDFIETGNGADRAFGNSGMDTIFGGTGNDLLNGGPQNDSLYGEEGADRLIGSTGDDLLEGGPDLDVLIGGAGEDEEIQ